MIDFDKAFGALQGGGIEFIVIGGVAAALQGSARTTADLDVVYRRSRENLQRLVEGLEPYSPYLRGAPPGLPFKFDLGTLRNGLNFTLSTSFGDLDLLGEVAGGGNYEALLPHSAEVVGFNCRFHLVSLEKLIHLKRAAGRPKDLEALAELQLILQRRKTVSGQL